MARLVLGPVLRYVDETEATVWVETDAPCEVAVLGRESRTFHVAGHHYALVHVAGLEPGTATPYEVHLDGERSGRCPTAPFPPSVIRTPARTSRRAIVFGSCRVSVPHEPPYSLRKDDDDRGREVDALRALALRMRDQPPTEWPDAAAHARRPGLRRRGLARTCASSSRSRRDPDEPPGEEVADFEEYTRLYWESWGEPVMRWLLSTVATAMIFDDHDVHDDWNISESWLEDMRAQPLVGRAHRRRRSCRTGSTSTSATSRPTTCTRTRCTTRSAAPRTARSSCASSRSRADRETEGTRWSFCRDYGGVRAWS